MISWRRKSQARFISKNNSIMFSVWDKVKVVDWLEVDKKYWIIECSKDHRDAHWMEWEIVEVFGEGVWYQVSFDPWLTFDESMLELIESSKVNEVVQQPMEANGPVPIATKRQIVSNKLMCYQKMIDKLEEVDRDMFFWMLYDKLESILYEIYWQ